mmetsp:Transcript_8924/g.15775  ORF Transcript_8924/g.15775 Transcript_8924/m.15775 type:complete len:219 (-) Transcript_8924:104-760(-)
MNPQHPPPDLLNPPPFIIHTFDFLRHFVLFFLVPIAVVALSALFAAALALRIHRAFFARYATPEELLEDSLKQLKNNERRRSLSRSSSSVSRKKALETLRLVIQLRPDMMEAYIVLATELFYGDISDGSGESDEKQRRRNTNSNTALRRRTAQTSEQSHDATNHLIECQEIVKQGLCIDDKNESLLNLQNELQLVNKYGRNGAYAKMMNIGSFGWMNG